MFGLFSKCRHFPTTVSPNGLIGIQEILKTFKTILRNLVRSRWRFFRAPTFPILHIRGRRNSSRARFLCPPVCGLVGRLNWFIEMNCVICRQVRRQYIRLSLRNRWHSTAAAILANDKGKKLTEYSIHREIYGEERTSFTFSFTCPDCIYFTTTSLFFKLIATAFDDSKIEFPTSSSIPSPKPNSNFLRLATQFNIIQQNWRNRVLYMNASYAVVFITVHENEHVAPLLQ